MTSAPINPLDVPPYQIQHLIADLTNGRSVEGDTPTIQVRCAQALGSELYVGCSNGALIRCALQADDPDKLESYSILSRQTLPNEKPIDEIVLIPCISRALILSDHQIYFYTLPSLDIVPPNVIKPIRHVITFAVDHQHLQRPPPSMSGPVIPVEPIEFCVVKRSTIVMYALRERLVYQNEIPLPQGATLARRTGLSLCVADKTHYNMIDLKGASLFQILPLSQAIDPVEFAVKPSITVTGENEFLILSWTGASTLGLFITGDGDPVRGTLEWPSHPESVCLDYPYITTLLPNNTIEIHSVETQAIVQVISAPLPSPQKSPSSPVFQPLRMHLTACLNGYLVPSTKQSDKLRLKPVRLLRGSDHNT